MRLDDGTQRPEPFPERATAPREQPDFVVSCLAYALGEAQAAVSWIAYTRLAKRWNAAGGPSLYFNYAYAAGWAGVLTVLIVLTGVWSAFALAAALIASLRFLEIAVWYLKLLFDSRHRLILSPERNLLFLTIDAVATIVVVGLWLAAVPGEGSIGDWNAAIATFTLKGVPAGFSGLRADVATVIGTLGGLLLIGAGLALLVGLVGE